MTEKILENRYNILLIILSSLIISGASYSLNYPKIPIGWVMPFSLIPVFVGIQKIVFSSKNKTSNSICREAFLLFWFFGYIIQFIIFLWVPKPFIYFGSIPNYLAYALFVLITIPISLYFPLLFSPFIFSLWYKNKFSEKKLFIFPIACAITFIEIYTPRLCNWSLGTSLSSNIIWNQLESIFGFNTGSLFIIYISLLLSSLFPPNNNNRLRFNKSFFYNPHIIMCSVIILFATLFGLIRITILDKTLAQAKHIRVAFIQPNYTFNSFANIVVPSKYAQPQSLDRSLQMSEEALKKSIKFDGKKPDLLVWPETVAPVLIFITPQDVLKVAQLSQSWGVPFLVEGIEIRKEDIQKYGISEVLTWSSSAIINAVGIRSPFFQKWNPVPFGESVPLENMLPFLGKWYRAYFKNAGYKIEHGTSYNALYVKDNVFVTPLICYDGLDSRLSYMSVRKGNSSFFVHQSNLVWMADSNLGFQFSMLDQMRAIENGRSIVVASNGGPSLAFDAVGRLILPPTALLTQDVNFVDIPLYTGKTLYQIVHHWPLTILGLLSACYFMCILRPNTTK